MNSLRESDEVYPKYKIYHTDTKREYICTYNCRDFNDVINVMYSDRSDLLKYMIVVDTLYNIKLNDLILN